MGDDPDSGSGVIPGGVDCFRVGSFGSRYVISVRKR